MFVGFFFGGYFVAPCQRLQNGQMLANTNHEP